MAEEQYYTNKIKELKPSIVHALGKNFKVHHEFSLTMIDGKTRSFLTNCTAFSNCPVCGAKPTQMNQPGREASSDAFKYGLSPLHARIRFLECN